MAEQTKDPAARKVSPRSKRETILTTAADFFGRQGYEDTKWADVATEVGIGSTALYHYFETKLHCLFVIMAEALESFRTDFDEVTGAHEDFTEGLTALLVANFDLTDQEVNRCRLLVAEQGRIGLARRSPREEEARQMARARTRDLEVTWANYLSRGMARGAIPEADPQLLTRATLGLYNSVWHWYRPRGILSLPEVADFFVPRQLAIIGAPVEAYTPQAKKTRAKK
ncbi:MAG TPA: TetR family transcriptional regulator [Solirubrobacteraceae bacterium]